MSDLGKVFALLAIGIGAVATYFLVKKISEAKIREKVRATQNAVKAQIKEIRRTGNYNTVNIGLYDDNNNEIEEEHYPDVEIEGNLYEGQVIYA